MASISRSGMTLVQENHGPSKLPDISLAVGELNELPKVKNNEGTQTEGQNIGH